VLAAAAASTRSIRLGSAVTVLSTDDPVRVFQQFATVDAISGGRAEITAGRGSSTESFPLFGHELADYDRLYSEKLDLLLRLNESERVTWSGTVRAPLVDAAVVPRPVHGRMPIWLGTGGSPGSSARAGMLGLPIAYGIIGGDAHRFGPLAELYRAAADEAGHFSGAQIDVAVASPGLVARDGRAAKDTYFRHWSAAITENGRRGLPSVSRADFDAQVDGRGAVFAGSPTEIAERIVSLHHSLGHGRHIFQMDVGSIPQATVLESIELLATEVAPIVRAELGPRVGAPA
jgi:alkanesulfonate monooxygenase SsuD/methylene tetrahydromethanopterin reductase-like flavin-dependent oxidoreductase (luciferase family)